MPPTGSGSGPMPPTGSGPNPPTGSGSGSGPQPPTGSGTNPFPGTTPTAGSRGPGVPWSLATQKDVKAKLYKIFSPHQALSLYKDIHDEGVNSVFNEVEVEMKN